MKSEIYGTDGICKMVSKCDYIVAALPLTALTKNYINRTVFEAMKSNAVILIYFKLIKLNHRYLSILVEEILLLKMTL